MPFLCLPVLPPHLEPILLHIVTYQFGQGALRKCKANTWLSAIASCMGGSSLVCARLVSLFLYVCAPGVMFVFTLLVKAGMY